MTDFFDKVDFTPDDVDKAVAAAKAQADKNSERRICICGHGARSHSSHGVSENAKFLRDRGLFRCAAGRVKCPCQEFRPVAITSDVRRFTAKTEGPAGLHALSKGARMATENGATVEWLEGVGCDRCHKTDVAIVPVAYAPGYYEASSATAINRLVCAECRLLTQQEAAQPTAVAPETVTP